MKELVSQNKLDAQPVLALNNRINFAINTLRSGKARIDIEFTRRNDWYDVRDDWNLYYYNSDGKLRLSFTSADQTNVARHLILNIFGECECKILPIIKFKHKVTSSIGVARSKLKKIYNICFLQHDC